MFLSMIIPVYNDEKYLRECLESCLDQDYPKDDYEIICVDDGSTDCSPEILLEYSKNYQNVIPILKEHGLPTGRTVGFEEAKGDYIWFVDHDDIVAPNAVSDLKKISDENAEYDRIAFPCYEFFEELTEEEQDRLAKGKLTSNDGPYVQLIYVWSSIIKRQFLNKNCISPLSNRIESARNYWKIPLTGVWGTDNLFMEECFDKGIKTLSIEGRPLYHYRRHNSSETMALSKASRDYKALLRYNTAMVRAYNAMMLKEKYEDERARLGQATEETTVQMIVKLRMAVSRLSILPRTYWKQGISLLKEKDAFFSKKPEEYHYPLASYLKQFGLRTRYSPQNIAAYYLFTLAGARCYRLLSLFDREAMKSEWLTKLHRKRKRSKLLRAGTKADN